MDIAIIERARNGDEEAFVLIYENYSPQIHRYVYRLVGNAELADDITQETFLKAFQGIKSIARDSNISAWLYRIASNACFDVLRRRKLILWLPILEHDDKSDEFTSDDFTPQVIESQIVRRTLREISPALAVCLVLRSVEGFSCEEIAEILKIPKGTVFSRLARAREAFIQAYKANARYSTGPLSEADLEEKLALPEDGRRATGDGRPQGSGHDTQRRPSPKRNGGKQG
jgi:RNA polymerase sigma-70 factor (ECF subfamily)